MGGNRRRGQFWGFWAYGDAEGLGILARKCSLLIDSHVGMRLLIFEISPSAPPPPSSMDKGVSSSPGNFFPWR